MASQQSKLLLMHYGSMSSHEQPLQTTAAAQLPVSTLVSAATRNGWMRVRAYGTIQLL
jgi:hypothetical protein